MKHNTKRIIVALLVLTLASAGLFAAAVREEAINNVRLDDLDLTSASYEQIMETFAKWQENYDKKYESIYAKMVDFYRAGDVENYFDAKSMLMDLEVPAVTSEQTQILAERLSAEEDAEKKEDFSVWLYENSRYYRPTITFTRVQDEQENVRSFRASYRYSISTKPGSMVTLPTVATTFSSAEGMFVGWGTREGEVLYEAGQEIEMPYADLTLYPIYKAGVLFVDTVTETEVFEDGDEINAPVLTPPDETYVFMGWYDASGNKADGSASLAEGESAKYTAQWKSFSIKDVAVRGTEDLSVQAGSKVKLTFTLKNNGNMKSGAFTIELVPEKEDTIVNSTGRFSSSGMRAGESKSGTFTITVKGNSGDTVNAKIVVKDQDGNEWSVPVKLKIK
ncbi:MAG: hypothetical protein J5775_02155 [Spirochaetales bacterium]|nr:hypothetical protein [Spirochaetales bacterium]